MTILKKQKMPILLNCTLLSSKRRIIDKLYGYIFVVGYRPHKHIVCYFDHLERNCVVVVVVVVAAQLEF